MSKIENPKELDKTRARVDLEIAISALEQTLVDTDEEPTRLRMRFVLKCLVRLRKEISGD